MQIALAIMFVASIFLYVLLVSIKARTEALVREQNSRWVKEKIQELDITSIQSKSLILLKIFVGIVIVVFIIVFTDYIVELQKNSDLTLIKYLDFLPYGKYALYVLLSYTLCMLTIISLFIGADINHKNTFSYLKTKYAINND